MISLPTYQPMQWIIIDNKHAFAQIVNASEGTEGGWTYQVSTDGAEILDIEEAEVQAYLENGKWVKKSVVTTQSVYS
jgi:hypothetical protein